MNRHAHSAVQGALLAARQEVANGQAPSKLNTDMISEQVGMLTGREIGETLHGDSCFATNLAEIASAAGPPSTFTRLTGNGQIFNACNIPSSTSNHR